MKNTLFLEGRTFRGLYVDGRYSANSPGDSPRFTTTGQSRILTFYPTSSSEPSRVTVAWHDYPTALFITSGSLVNNLYLRAYHNGANYYPNGGSGDDYYNNVERIIINSPTPGVPITVTGRAA